VTTKVDIVGTGTPFSNPLSATPIADTTLFLPSVWRHFALTLNDAGGSTSLKTLLQVYADGVLLTGVNTDRNKMTLNSNTDEVCWGLLFLPLP